MDEKRHGKSSDTIAAISTPPGKGAIAIVRMSGDSALTIAREVFVPGSGTEPGMPGLRRGLQVGSIRDEKRNRNVDRSIMAVHPGPGSYTGEDVVEFHCHGGDITPRLVLRTLIEAGCRQALRGEFTLRAFLNGKLDLIQAESILDVIESKSEFAQREAILRLEGSLSAIVKELKDTITDLTARVEYFIDFPEEDDLIEYLDGEKETAGLLTEKLDHLLSSAMEANMLEDGVLVVIAGAPNVGKSSLFNLLLETERAIVTPYPGTTRDAVEAVAEIRGLPVRLVDTAGLRRTEDPVEKMGLEFSRRYLGAADVILFLVEANRNLNTEEIKFLEEYDNACVGVVNKADLGVAIDTKALERVRDLVTISCVERSGIRELKDILCRSTEEALRAEGDADSTILIHARHREGLTRAREAIVRFRGGLNKLPPEILACELREAREAMEELTGRITPEDVLERIFAKFCVGK